MNFSLYQAMHDSDFSLWEETCQRSLLISMGDWGVKKSVRGEGDIEEE